MTPPAPSSNHIAAILLAAGLSTRMGRLKPLLPWMGSTLLEYQLRQLSLSPVDEIVLVLGHEAEKLRPYADAVPDIRVVVNPDYHRGRSTSVVAGVKALGGRPSAILILSVDQPRPAWVISQVVKAHLDGTAEITIPTFEGRRGHPIVFDGGLIDELKALSEEAQGLREVVGRDPGRVREIEVSSPVIHLDLNTPEDYQRGQGLTKSPHRYFESCTD